MKLKFIWIGKLKRPFWRDAAAHYWKRLHKRFKIEEACIKDGPGKLSPHARTEHESEAIMSRLTPQDILVCLDETGKNCTSKELAEYLRTWLEDPGRTPCFVIGGAYGLSRALKHRADFLISLGRITLPHEMARVVLLEQLYRADTILRGLPYHH